MMSKLSFVLVFASGLAVALLATFLPSLMGFLGDKKVKRLASGFGRDYSRRSNQMVMFSPMVPSLHTSKEMTAKSGTGAEALSAINIAKEMVSQGKHEKALKLYEHAVALDPGHPDILNEYGEYLEKHKKDIVSAEHMYCRALTLSPDHSKALTNRQRTLPLVEEIDQNRFNRIDQKRDWLVQVPDNHPGMRRMKKESYYKHIYHTTAMEGNTFSMAQGKALLETGMAIGGKSIIEHNEILGLDAALSYVNNTLIRKIGAISLDDVLQIHKRVMGYVDLNEAGRIRTTQVYVADYVPPSAGEVGKLMEDFIEWLNSDDAINNMHPIEYAALAHYKLVSIHPFYDGNGRTSRLVMNLVLMQAGYPPIVVKVEDKHLYYQHLDTANRGDVRPFIRFIAKCTETTLDEFLWAASEHPNVTFPELGTNGDDGKTIIMDKEKD